WHLCLDRTNWKIGKTDVNVLVLAVITARFRVPLMWTMLPHSGNSTTAQRIALMKRYLAYFDASTVRMLLADREFIGQEWFTFLVEQEIPFAIRMKEGQIVRTNGRELLVVASPYPATGAHILRQYKKRWLIECLFADSKTRGLNLEDTRLTLASKLSLLIAITAIAIALICRAAAQLMGHKYPARKKHGYCSKSWFRTGFDEVRRWMRSGPETPLVARNLVVPRRLRVGVV
ncbi:transposase, partial [Jannaschia seosinensis]